MVVLPVAGACVCCVQVARGCINTPKAISSAAKGKRWDQETRRWVGTPGTALVIAQGATATSTSGRTTAAIGANSTASDVAFEHTRLNTHLQQQETYLSTAIENPNHLGGELDYYKVLGVSRGATEQEIKQSYYHLARRYHPDKNKDNPNAHERFQVLGEAYQVLSDKDLREKYDRHGKDALDVDFMDYACVFTILFGAENFEPLIGELMLATATGRGGDLDSKEMNKLQASRVEALALSLSELLSQWVTGERESFMEKMHAYGEDLSKCSFGPQLLGVISNIYAIQSERALGGFSGFQAAFKMQKQKIKSSMQVAGAAMKVMQAHFEIKNLNSQWEDQHKHLQDQQERSGHQEEGGIGISTAQGTGASSSSQQHGIEEDLVGSAHTGADTAGASLGTRKAKLEAMALPLMLEAMWAANVVDIETTVASVCKSVLYDKQVPKASRKERALGLHKLAEILLHHSQPPLSNLSKAQSARQKLSDALFQFQQKKLDEEDAKATY
jgi:curved DNA-binding protein CbpA